VLNEMPFSFAFFSLTFVEHFADPNEACGKTTEQKEEFSCSFMIDIRT